MGAETDELHNSFLIIGESLSMKYLFTVLLFFFSSQTMATELKTADDARSLANNIMKLVAKGEIKNGLLLAKPYMNVSDSNFTKIIDTFEKKQPTMLEKSGKAIGVEFISDIIAGKSFMKITFAQKFEKHARRWVFYFYKPETSWQLNTFTADDKIQMLFE